MSGYPSLSLIAHGYAHPVIAVPGICEAGLHGYVGEGAVFVLTVEAIPVQRVVAIEIFCGSKGIIRYMASVYQEDIQEAIIVVVQ
jgi:hypothetical protein